MKRSQETKSSKFEPADASLLFFVTEAVTREALSHELYRKEPEKPEMILVEGNKRGSITASEGRIDFFL